MKNTCQKLLVILCVMTLVSTGYIVLSIAEEVPGESFAVEEQPVSEMAAEETQPVPVPAKEPASSSETLTASAEMPAQTEIHAAEAPIQANAEETLLADETAHAETFQDKETPAEDAAVEESFLTEATEQTKNDVAHEEAAVETSASPEVNPAAGETVTVEGIPAQELIPADLTVETLTEANGVVNAEHPFVIRLISNMVGKVKVTVAAGNPLYVQFGNEVGEIISEHYPEEDGKVIFSYGAEYGESVLLYVWSIGVNEDGNMIESVPFHISSEKTEPAQEEMLNVFVEQEGVTSAGETGKTEEAVRAAEEAGDAAETSEAVRVRRVVLSGRDGSSFKEGETVHLSVNLEGFEDINEFMIIWEANHGEGWKEVSRGANNFYSFPASAESLNAEYRVRVLFR